MLEISIGFEFLSNAADSRLCSNLVYWRGHSSTITLFSWNQFFVNFAVCVGLFIMLSNPVKGILNGNQVFFQIILIRCGIHLQSIDDMLPVPFVEKHPQTMMLSPPNFTVGIIFFWFEDLPIFLHIRFLELRPNNSILNSSVHNTLSQYNFFILLYSRTNFNLSSPRHFTAVEFYEGSLTLDSSYEFHCLSFVYWHKFLMKANHPVTLEV